MKNQLYCSNFTEVESQDQNWNIGFIAGISKKSVNWHYHHFPTEN